MGTNFEQNLHKGPCRGAVQVMHMEDAVAHVLAGLAASTAFYLLVLPLLPSSVREKVSRWKMRLHKYVLSPTVSVEMVAKAAAREEGVPIGDMQERVAGCMRSAGLKVASGSLSLAAPVRVGQQTLDLSVKFSPDGDGAFEQADVVVGARCGYRDFESCITEVREAQTKAKGVLSGAGMALEGRFCVVCRLKSLPQAKAMLDSIKADTMSYRTPDGRMFDLYDNKIEYYDTEVHRGMTSFLKRVLVAHS